MFTRIVVPLDGSAFSRKALDYAVALAGEGRTVIDLVSSIDSLAALGALGGPGLSALDVSAGTAGGAPSVATEVIQAERRGRTRELEATAEELGRTSSAQVEWTVLDGEPSDVIAEHVEARGADLVVMSTHGRGAIQRAWLGSVADRLVRRLDVPLLLVRPPDPAEEGDAAAEAAVKERVVPEIRSILVPLDGSELAEAVLPTVSRAARSLGASVTLLRVTGLPLIVGSPYIPHAAQEYQEHFDRERQQALAYLEGVSERLAAEGVRVADLEVREGVAADTILDIAHDSADVVAMATHGRGGFRRWFLGSVSDKVLRGARLPVLLVRPEGQGDERD